MPNLFSRIGSSLKAFIFGDSQNQPIRPINDADLRENGWHPSRPHTSSTEQRSVQLVRPPAQRADAASRRRIEQSRTPLSNIEQNALTKAQKAVDGYKDFKENKRQLKVHLGPVRGQKTYREKIALALVASMIESDPTLKNKALQFDIQTLPLPTPEDEAKNLAMGLALSAIEHKLDSLGLGHQFDVRIGPPTGDKTMMEDVALDVGLYVIEQDPLLKNTGLQIDVRMKPTPHQRSDEDNRAIDIALFELEKIAMLKQQQQQPTSGNPVA